MFVKHKKGKESKRSGELRSNLARRFYESIKKQIIHR